MSCTNLSRLAPLAAVSVTAVLLLGGCSSVGGDDPAAPEESSTSTEGSASEGTPAETDSVGTLDVGEQEDCLPGNWYPDMEEFTALRSAGLQLPVEGLEGSIMVTIRGDGTMTTNYDELSYSVTPQNGTIETTHSGNVSAEYEVTSEGATIIHGRGVLNDNTQAETIVTKNGVQEVVSYPLPPIVFDRITLVCDGEQTILTNPFGSLTMYREH